MGRFGRPLPAAGFALHLERLHVAQAEEGVAMRGRAERSRSRLAPRGEGPLKLAVPRGALLAGTLDLLDAIGVETGELRGDSRALVFDAGELTLVTMRPSDVPTYVEAGAADLGITGKDVLAEQRDRAVYELLDLGFGACRMVLAGRRGDAQPRRVRAATRRDADRDQVPAHGGALVRADRAPGRGDRGQGLGRAGAARRARGRDRRSRRQRPDPGRERSRGARGDRRLHGAPGRQPGRPQASRGRGRRTRRADARGGAR